LIIAQCKLAVGQSAEIFCAKIEIGLSATPKAKARGQRQMALSELTRNSVLQALAEFDELGRDEFLDRYKFGKARGYFVVHNGRRYDSKAIAGAAHAHAFDGAEALLASDFSGGEKTVANKLRELGFTVTEPVDRVEEPLPFEAGNVYHRQRDIHEVYGGKSAAE
jgi:hypothetical protein